MTDLKKNKIFFAFVALILALCLAACAQPGDGTNTESEHNISIPAESTEASVPPAAASIAGVKKTHTVYEDDTADAIRTALLEGVSAEGHEIKIKLLSGDLSALTAGDYIVNYYCDDPAVSAVASKLTVLPADKTPPEIIGAADMVVELGSNVSYRSGVSAADNGEAVAFSIDASGVDLTKLGTYSVTYSATDKRGNTATKTVKITVIQNNSVGGSANNVCTEAQFNDLINGIIAQIIRPGMTDREKARAIYDRVHSIKYTGTAEGDDNQMVAAYIGLTTGRGDCQNYAAASKALLTAAGIPNHDMTRFGGTTRHFWNIAYVDGGWYHFDACPTLKKYPLEIFLLTDDEAIAYSEKCVDRPNYLIYDHDACPYEVVKSRTSDQ